MTNILSTLGLSDGQGNISSMRLVLFLIVLAILAPDVYIAFKTATPLNVPSQQLEVLATVLSAKLMQNHQENQGANPEPPKQ
jgi:hypothetical protein